MLSKLGNSVNQADESGWVPLHYSAYFGNFQVVRKILDKDQRSAYATDKDRNRTALDHIPACRGHLLITIHIIYTFPECCGIRGVRAWNFPHYAVVRRFEEAIRETMHDPSLVYLINERDIKGYTPLHLLLVSSYSTSLHSWIRDVSAVPSKFLSDEFSSIFRNEDFLVDMDSNRIERERTKDLGTEN
ncbi:hypothetical protein M5689_005936 [Euphorbia peplus]|nr:hypothetical protein M5689_005936 [Euphorbia peplus]